MGAVRTVLVIGIVALVAAGCAGAASRPAPLRHLALERPAAPIGPKEHRATTRSFSRGGWYFVNANFRPSAPLDHYVREAQRDVGGAEILYDADVQLAVPFAIDVLLFGYNTATDKVTAGMPLGNP